MGIALPTDSLAEDISQFFDRMHQHDRDLATALRDEQDKRALAYNKNRSQPVYYKAGQRVWVKHAPDRDKHCPCWQGPCLIQKVLGIHSYQVQTSPVHSRNCHADYPKKYYAPLVGKPWPLFYTKVDSATNDEDPGTWEFEKPIAHRTRNSRLEFKARWRGFGPRHDTWEPASSFLPNYNELWLAYLRKHNLQVAAPANLGA